MNRDFTGEEVVYLLRHESERRAYKMWDEPNFTRGQFFSKHVWLSTDWTRAAYSGFLQGANFWREFEKMDLGERQCLKHHFCTLKEQGVDLRQYLGLDNVTE